MKQHKAVSSLGKKDIFLSEESTFQYNFRVHTQKVWIFFQDLPRSFFEQILFFSQDKYHACIYTQGLDTRTLIVLYIYNSCGIYNFLRKKVGKACRIELIIWESDRFSADRGVHQSFIFPGFSKTFFHFQVLSRPGTCHCKSTFQDFQDA